ncbi:cAMP-specific 3',5'-cyclic phosphodiesterase [Achlya hypogyna]|uniref:Phosphodiesterase n=1 Tax=Achlya hypogyna TaxID=1202772 RepID=A0A1V9ZAI5_ACHHY|nr:cAMP-specific 3',5'-cyclic phosphodiesterase [Achlya hypogyna]
MHGPLDMDAEARLVVARRASIRPWPSPPRRPSVVRPLSKHPICKSAPDVFATYRQKTDMTIVAPDPTATIELSLQSPPPRSNGSAGSVTPPFAHLKPLMKLGPHLLAKEIDWSDIVDIDDVDMLCDDSDSDEDERGEVTPEVVRLALSLTAPGVLPPADVLAVTKIMMDSDNGFGTWHFNVLQVAAYLPRSVLSFLSVAMFAVLGYEDIDLPVLAAFSADIEAKYNREVIYHNADHAADVMHSFFAILRNTNLVALLSETHQIAGLLAALMHDVQHFGLTNKYLKQAEHDLARTFPVCCPLEAMHSDVGLKVLSSHNLLKRFSPSLQADMRHTIHETIWTTSVCEQKRLLAALAAADRSSKEYLTLIVQIAVHVADLGQTSKPLHIHKVWVDRLHGELFLQGDLERARGWPLSIDCDRAQGICPKSQTFFMEAFVVPAFSALRNLPGMDDMDSPLRQVEHNIAHWKRV